MNRQELLARFTIDELRGMLIYLDALRESGATNMYGAGSYLRKRFVIGKAESHAVLAHWMETYAARHPQKEATA